MQNFSLFQRLTCAAVLAVSGSVAATPEMSNIPASVQQSIAAACLSVHHLGGREAYRECVVAEAAAHNAGDRSALSNLTFDERVMVMQRCQSTDSTADCLQNEAQIAGLPPERLLGNLSPGEQKLARAACLDAGGSGSVADYRQCLAEQNSAATGTLPVPATTAAESFSNDNASAADSSLSVNSDAQSSDTSTQTALGSNELAVNSNTSNPDDTVADPLAGDAPAIEPDIASGNPSPATDLMGWVRSAGSTLSGLWDQLENTAAKAGLPAAGIPVIAAGGAVLLLLWRWLVSRRRRRELALRQSRPLANASPYDLDDDDDVLNSIDEFVGEADEPTMIRSVEDEQGHPAYPAQAPAHGPLDEEDFEFTQHRYDDPDAPVTTVDQNAVTQIANGPWLDELDVETKAATVLAEHDMGEPVMSEFGRWLQEQDPAERLPYCFEFFIYWTAYADGRYPLSLKKRLFTARELGGRDLIKRWVLQEDVEAFADGVLWMQKHTTRLEREQTLDILMALLVHEDSITPVQVTVLRLLSDGFGIGSEQLEMGFHQAFGEELPPLPRPDRIAWWERQNPEQVANWSPGRRVEQTDNDRCRDLLGLPENYREVDVIKAYRRAARRCHPDRFSELGGRARTLAAAQFDKFEEARDRLLGVLV